MQPEFWNDKRPAGVPDSLDFAAYRSVVEVFERSCKKFADRPAFSNLGVTLSYAELDRLSAAFAAYLQKQTDLQPGDRIAVQMPNVLQYPIAVFGALRAGLVVVNTNPLYTAREMRHQFKDAGVRALVYLNVFGKLVEEVLPDTRIEYLIEARMGDLLPALKGWLVNSVVKSVKKMVPDYRLPQALPFRRGLEARPGPCPAAGQGRPGGCRRVAVHRRHHRESRRGRCSPTATWWRTCCRSTPSFPSSARMACR